MSLPSSFVAQIERQSANAPFLRSFTTIVRFDPGYYTLFRCNIKMIRHDYPSIHRWLLHVYWDGSLEETRGAFRSTTNFKAVSTLHFLWFG